MSPQFKSCFFFFFIVVSLLFVPSCSLSCFISGAFVCRLFTWNVFLNLKMKKRIGTFQMAYRKGKLVCDGAQSAGLQRSPNIFVRFWFCIKYIERLYEYIEENYIICNRILGYIEKKKSPCDARRKLQWISRVSCPSTLCQLWTWFLFSFD
jgi:hypothetical protein